MWWHIPRILEKQKQEALKFQGSLGTQRETIWKGNNKQQTEQCKQWWLVVVVAAAAVEEEEKEEQEEEEKQ